MLPDNDVDMTDAISGFPDQVPLGEEGLYQRVQHALRGRTMAWLARETGVSTSTLSEMKTGKVPRAPNLIRIAKALKVDLEWLLTGEMASKAAMGASPSALRPDQLGVLEMFERLSWREREAVYALMGKLTGFEIEADEHAARGAQQRASLEAAVKSLHSPRMTYRDEGE